MSGYLNLLWKAASLQSDAKEQLATIVNDEDDNISPHAVDTTGVNVINFPVQRVRTNSLETPPTTHLVTPELLRDMNARLRSTERNLFQAPPSVSLHHVTDADLHDAIRKLKPTTTDGATKPRRKVRVRRRRKVERLPTPPPPPHIPRTPSPPPLPRSIYTTPSPTLSPLPSPTPSRLPTPPMPFFEQPEGFTQGDGGYLEYQWRSTDHLYSAPMGLPPSIFPTPAYLQMEECSEDEDVKEMKQQESGLFNSPRRFSL